MMGVQTFATTPAEPITPSDVHVAYQATCAGHHVKLGYTPGIGHVRSTIDHIRVDEQAISAADIAELNRFIGPASLESVTLWGCGADGPHTYSVMVSISAGSAKWLSRAENTRFVIDRGHLRAK